MASPEPPPQSSPGGGKLAGRLQECHSWWPKWCQAALGPSKIRPNTSKLSSHIPKKLPQEHVFRCCLVPLLQTRRWKGRLKKTTIPLCFLMFVPPLTATDIFLMFVLLLAATDIRSHLRTLHVGRLTLMREGGWRKRDRWPSSLSSLSLLICLRCLLLTLFALCVTVSSYVILTHVFRPCRWQFH